ncbi:MAG: glucuronate isomerase [Clostridia bacterium]|nr:glucuronate isomerase [Clostridia bacterium]MBP3583897.1 glucuronate isomerase [Clostridia bacterium]
MSFINDNFMLKNEPAKKLYNMIKDLPIIDYHCHLQPKQIAENYQFKNAFDLFLGGDHYKWRQMRTAGVDEEYITGNADEYEKFKAFARTLPRLIGNPLYHWTHLELKRYFDIDETLNEESCERIWNKCNELLAKPEYRAKELIKRSNVEVICTTDDPIDTLEYHKALRGFSTKILPTFRPDKAVEIGKETFIPYVEQVGVKTYGELVAWIKDRIAFFNSYGCRLSDHALEYVPYAVGDAEAAFNKRMAGETLTKEEIDSFKTAMLKACAEEYVKYGWAMQLHIGALRNNNRRMYDKLGPDTGFDSINDLAIAEDLAAFMNHLEMSECLPKTILYTLNPKDNYVLGTMLGCFQAAPTAGKIQFGSGWWFNDQRDGMEAQMQALANLGMLSAFVGMLTDSRSFVSYPRHEYFRRILCNLIGKWVDEGEYPADYVQLEKIVKGIAYENAKAYFNF